MWEVTSILSYIKRVERGNFQEKTPECCLIL